MADAVFKKYDTNHNGKLEASEFSKLLSEEYDYDTKDAKEVVAELFKVHFKIMEINRQKTDSDNNGFISRDEFAKAVFNAADKTFKKYDVDDNSKLDLAEFTKLLINEYGYDAIKAKKVMEEEFKVICKIFDNLIPSRKPILTSLGS